MRIPTFAPPLDAEALIALRRDLHAHPELSHQEERTAAVVTQVLEGLGLSPRTRVGGWGVIVDIVGAHPGPCLLFRADMDALPIQEIQDDARPWASTRPGVMHACGHDVHTTVGLGVAARLAGLRDQLHGTVRVVFQPAEEAAPPPGRAIGGEAMVEDGALEAPAVDAAFALHVMPTLPVGTIGYTGGPVWAGSDLFDLHVRGRMAHGAYPHEGTDTVLAAAAIVQACQQIVARNVDTRQCAVVSFCRVQGGTAYNILPDAMHLQGLARFHSLEVRDQMRARMREIVELVARAHGCEATLDLFVGTHPTCNDPALEAWTVQALTRHGALQPVATLPQMGAEDFSAFSRRVPSCYLLLGVRNEARGIVHMIHTPAFDVDESCLAPAADAMASALREAGAGWSTLAPTLGG
jgi:amidohydrolase